MSWCPDAGKPCLRERGLLLSHHVPLNQKKIVLPGNITTVLSHGMSYCDSTIWH
uniref:Uncharacterized protein n=1 Tax=Arundo donax TaxID=35708 RepID=A0A0A9EF65_ARUDO